MTNVPSWIIIHCTDYPRSLMADQFLACDSWHKDRGFPKSSVGYYIGYHAMITGERIRFARLDSDVGAHCNQIVDGKSMNYQSLSICLGFDGDVEMPTAMEYALLQKQIWEWQRLYDIPDANVKPHRHYAKDKTCPGKLLTDEWLKELLKRPVAVDKPPIKETQCLDERKQIETLKAEKNNLWVFIKNLLRIS